MKRIFSKNYAKQIKSAEFFNMIKTSLKKPDPIYHLRYGFGDKWAVTSYLLKKSEIEKKIILFDSDNYDLIYKIASFFNTNGRIEHKKSNLIFEENYNTVYTTKYVPTKKVWQENKNKIITYQFDGRCGSSLKNPPDHEIHQFITFFEKLGYKTIDLGNYKPISFIIDSLSSCQFYVGCSSGIANVNMSVNAPMYIVKQNLPDDDSEPLGYKYLRKIVYSTRKDIIYVENLEEIINQRKKSQKIL